MSSLFYFYVFWNSFIPLKIWKTFFLWMSCLPSHYNRRQFSQITYIYYVSLITSYSSFLITWVKCLSHKKTGHQEAIIELIRFLGSKQASVFKEGLHPENHLVFIHCPQSSLPVCHLFLCIYYMILHSLSMYLYAIRHLLMS